MLGVVASVVVAHPKNVCLSHVKFVGRLIVPFSSFEFHLAYRVNAALPV